MDQPLGFQVLRKHWISNAPCLAQLFPDAILSGTPERALQFETTKARRAGAQLHAM